MAAANSTNHLIPAGRSSNGTPLYANPCPDCGKLRLSDKRRIGNFCMPCGAKRKAKHGLTGHPLYKLLNNIRARCEYASASGFEYYGGRGIAVCEEWRSDPAAFVAWADANGYEPGLELDRLDTNGPYAPWNCQFLPHDKNSRKRRNARCDEPTAARARELLASGASIRATAEAVGIPYMVAWHISKGNTWRE